MDGFASRSQTPAPNQGSTTPDRCSKCGVPITSSRMSLREMAVNLICGCLLLSILIPAGLLAGHWMEDASHRLVDRMVWREPLENWDQ